LRPGIKALLILLPAAGPAAFAQGRFDGTCGAPAAGKTIQVVFANPDAGTTTNFEFPGAASVPPRRAAFSRLFVHPVAGLAVRYNAVVPEVKPFRLTESVKAAG